MPTLKKCYYQVLGVERNAGDEEIKKSFRKLALQQHPDKNPDRADEAKAEFQILQQAYEVLSNPQERAWYDEHRQAVLREGLDPSDLDDFNIDLMSYCTSSGYKGFTDDDDGFYAVYRDLFSKLTAEELEAGWADENDDDIPNFGDSCSSYEDVVGPFYGFWESFCTLKSFAWNDEYDTRRAECRRIARLMDKENKKIRTDAKKAWNREVRALVDFVKRKDKRVQAWKTQQEIKLKQKEEELAKKVKDATDQRLAERKRLLESVKSHKKQNEEQHNPVLQEMEQWMSNEFGEQLSGADSDEESPTCFHCAACNKSFRTEKAFMNHEKSKKHLQQVEKLRELMQEEDELFEDSQTEGSEGEDLVENGLEDEEATTKPEVGQQMDNASNDLQTLKLESQTSEPDPNKTSEEHDSEEEEDLLQKQFFARAANRNKKSKKVQREIFNAESDHDLHPINLQSSDEDKPKPEKSNSKKPKKNKKQNKSTTTNKAESVLNPPEIETAQNSEAASVNSIDLTCMVCNVEFNTRTQLFRHIKNTGHAAPLESVKKAKTVFEASEKSNKKRKGKRAE